MNSDHNPVCKDRKLFVAFGDQEATNDFDMQRFTRVMGSEARVQLIEEEVRSEEVGMSILHFYFENFFKIRGERNSVLSKADPLAKQELSEKKIQVTEGFGDDGYRKQINTLIMTGGKIPCVLRLKGESEDDYRAFYFSKLVI